MRQIPFALKLILLLCALSESQYVGDEDNMSDVERRIQEILIREGEYDPMTSRIEPWETNEPYEVTEERLTEIREHLLYPYYDIDVHNQNGDYEQNINNYNTQVNKQLTFLLPFFGFGLNYTWVSLNGYLGFSDAPSRWGNYPLSFPVLEWPDRPDPSFIGPFYSKCNIGQLRPEQYMLERKPGVYWRLERDLPNRMDQLGAEIRERLKWDIRQGMVGTYNFNPKHVIIVTWKNVTFAGGSINSDAKHVTNTFQLLVTTDEIRTYAMFNYEYMAWTSHTEAGGSSDDGQGGTPAYVGFNAGNGTRAYEYSPYSQTLYIRDLAIHGKANGLPGRHMFRVDEVILAGCCRREETLQTYPLVFSPEHGNMLGGTLVNVTGPCFEEGYRVTCQFDATPVEGKILDGNTVLCIMPQLLISGYVDLGLSINGRPFYWRGKFFVETPLTTPEGVWFTDGSVFEQNPEQIKIQWLAGNLTQTAGATVNISLWGYKEASIFPEMIYIDDIGENVPNTDAEIIPYTISTADFANRDNEYLRDFEMGFIMIQLTVPEPLYRLPISTQVWSHPIPLAWYFRYQWEQTNGINWPVSKCERWVERDRNLRNFAYEVPRCPCLLSQAISDRGRFLPDFSCDKDGNTKCFYHYGAEHCVRSAMPNKDGAGQQCCYDRDGYLMMTTDQMWGGHPQRAHNFGMRPFDEANKIPSLSHWFHDITPFFSCCKWQSEQSPGCINFRFERRSSQDCVGYQPPTAASTFGDPHFYTFDSLQYTFNGLGEFVLVRVDSSRHILDIQGRFERIEPNYFGYAKASMLTAVAAKDNISSVVEIRRRPHNAMWRYRLDVLVDGRRVYFDRYSQKIQQFRECIVYTPSNILNQSQVIVMFSSGAGVEVVENRGYLAMRTFLPPSFTNLTRGLFGNWTYDPDDDFTLPDGTIGIDGFTTNLESIHKTFGMEWVLDDKESQYKGKSLFTHENTRSSNYYYHPYFVPEFDITPDLSVNSSIMNSRITRVCGDSYQCTFDYVTTLTRDFAMMTKYYQDEIVNLKENGLKYVTSCGILPTPPHGRKSTFNYMAGAEVKFDCDAGYVILGEQRRWCFPSGEWNWAEKGEAVCITEREYLTMQNGIVAGTVLAVLLPILLALACFLVYCKHRVKQNGTKDRYMFKTVPFGKHANRREVNTSAPTLVSTQTNGVANNANELTRLSKETEIHDIPLQEQYHLKEEDDDSSSCASSTTFDDSSDMPPPPFSTTVHRPVSPGRVGKVYYTREPVNDKPVIFQNRLWGVEEKTPSPDVLMPRAPDLSLHTSTTSQESAV